MSEQLWRLRIRGLNDEGGPGAVLGGAFVVSDQYAITCAHHFVFDCPEHDANTSEEELAYCEGTRYPEAEFWVDQPGVKGSERRCLIRSLRPNRHAFRADPTKDVALIELGAPYPKAPLAPATVPIPGAELELVGYPYNTVGDLRGQATWARVVGAPSNKLIQVNADSSQARITEGYSGGAATDRQSERVVGMVIQKDRNPEVRIGWVLPIGAIAEVWPPLARLLPADLEADPEYVRALHALHGGDYGTALRQLNNIYRAYPEEPDVYYYRALSALSRRRPGTFTSSTVEALDALLWKAANLGVEVPHVHVLSSLIHDDYYYLRGLQPRRYRDDALARHLRRMSPLHIEELLQHVPAPECPTYKALLTWRSS